MSQDYIKSCSDSSTLKLQKPAISVLLWATHLPIRRRDCALVSYRIIPPRQHCRMKTNPLVPLELALALVGSFITPFTSTAATPNAWQINDDSVVTGGY